MFPNDYFLSKKYFCCIWIHGTTKWSLQAEIFACFLCFQVKQQIFFGFLLIIQNYSNIRWIKQVVNCLNAHSGPLCVSCSYCWFTLIQTLDKGDCKLPHLSPRTDWPSVTLCHKTSLKSWWLISGRDRNSRRGLVQVILLLLQNYIL